MNIRRTARRELDNAPKNDDGRSVVEGSTHPTKLDKMTDQDRTSKSNDERRIVETTLLVPPQMSRHTRSLTLIYIVLFFGTSVWGQEPTIAIDSLGLRPLLYDKAVRNELNLSSEQEEKLNNRLGEQSRRQSTFRRQNKNLSEKQLSIHTKKIYDDSIADLKKDIPRLLDPEQLKRFIEIQLQYSGAIAFTRPEVQNALNLSSDQKLKTTALVQEMDKGLKQISLDSDEKRGQLRKELYAPYAGTQLTSADKIKIESDGRLKELGQNERVMKSQQWSRSFRKAYSFLTDSQKATWRLLTGTPYNGERKDPFLPN